MGAGVGCVGLSLDDFCACTPEEIQAIMEAWNRRTDNIERSAWERTRLGAAVSIQPHIKKGISPQKLIPLPWDSGPAEKKKTPAPSAEERAERFKELAQKRRKA